MIMRVAPIGAFGAMAFTIGTYGIGTLLSLGKLMAAFYLACLLFIFVGMGIIARVCGFSLLEVPQVHQGRDPHRARHLVVRVGAAAPDGEARTRSAARKRVVGLVVPTGYSMNLDGTSIYMAMASIFIAQATNTPLSLGQQLGSSPCCC